jgi:hypothetical protein
MFLTRQCGGCYVSDCLSGRTHFNHLWTTTEKLLYRHDELPRKRKFVLDKIVFSDGATFHLPGKVNRHNLIIWGSQNSKRAVKNVCDTPKVMFSVL